MYQVNFYCVEKYLSLPLYNRFGFPQTLNLSTGLDFNSLCLTVDIVFGE
jgi:hypothetical protein